MAFHPSLRGFVNAHARTGPAACHSILLRRKWPLRFRMLLPLRKRIALMGGFRLLGRFRLRAGFQRLGSCGYR